MLTVLMAALALAALFLLHCAVVGAVAWRLGPAESGSRHCGLRMFFSICLGMVANMAALFALGISGHFHLTGVFWLAGALPLAGLLAARLVRDEGAGGPATVSSDALASKGPACFLECAALLVLMVLPVLAALHPPGHWDDTMYQLPLARHYVEQQGIVLNEWLRFPLFPQNFNLLFALGLLLGGLMPPASAVGSVSAAGISAWQFGAPEVFAQLFASLPLSVMLLGLWCASRRYLGGGLPGLLAGLMLFMISPVKGTLGFAYVDNGLALFCWAALLVIAVMVESRHTALPLLAGVLAGAACGTKYFGLVFAAIAGLALLIGGLMQDRRAALRAALLYTLGVLMAGSAWYVRSYLISGDPAHPAGAPVFGYFLWNEGDLAEQYSEQGVHGVVRNPLMLPVALLEAGVLPWLPAFAGLFLRGVSRPLRLMQAVFLAYVLFWFFVSQVPRYLAPVYGVGCFLSLHALHWAWVWLGRRYLPQMKGSAFWPAAVVLALVVGYTADRGLKYGGEFADAEAVLSGNDGYALYQQANAAIPQFGPRLVQLGFEDGIYFFQGTVIGDWFGPGRYRDLVDCAGLPCELRPSRHLEAVLRQHQSCMLLLSRRLITGLDVQSWEAAGWQPLAANQHGALLVAPACVADAPATASRPTAPPPSAHRT